VSVPVPVPDPRPARAALQLQPQHAAYSDIRQACAQAEEMGVDIVFTWDHFYPLYGEPEGRHFECWTMLAAFAEATHRVEIGALVTCNSYRNPQLLADMARTVDHISDGRLILGIGSGWFEKDYDQYGYEFGTAGGRLDALDRDLPLIKSRLAKLNPPPTRDIPVLIGGGGERKTLRIVAEQADIWHGFGDSDTIAHKHRVLDQWCATVGRDPLEIERSSAVSTRDPATSAQSLYAVGTRLFTINAQGPDYDVGPLRDLLAWRDERNGV
jgi:probable F420-dependent oxidoreductase